MFYRRLFHAIWTLGFTIKKLPPLSTFALYLYLFACGGPLRGSFVIRDTAVQPYTYGY